MGNIIISFMGKVVAILANPSAILFSSHGTCLMIYSSSFFRCSPTMAKYRVIRSSFASYSRWICPTISWELFLIPNLVAANIRARSSPIMTTSYSTTLLKVEKFRRITCSISSLVGNCRITPTPGVWIKCPPLLSRAISWMCLFFREFNYKVSHNLPL